MKYIKYFLINTVLIYNLNAQWIPITGGALSGDIETLIAFNSNIYAGGGASIFRSTNNGVNWTSQMDIPAYASFVASSGNNIFVGIGNFSPNYTFGVYRSTNNGLNFSIVGLNGKVIYDLKGDSQQLVAIALETGNNLVFRSTSNGTNWFNITGNINLGVNDISLSGTKIYAGGQGIYVTSNSGNNWTNIFSGYDNVESILANDSLILAGTYSGIYRSTNNGEIWVRTLNLNKRINSLYQYGSNIFAGADTGFYVSADLGLTFTNRTELLGNARISSILVSNNYIFVSNSNFLSGNISAWKRPLIEIIGIQQISNEVPLNYKLNQNYPNPFNPSTKIRFDIPKSGNVNITVYDMLGREVTTLVNQQLSPGTYETDWDASGYSSGIYYYKIQSDDFVDTKKMVLIK